MRWNSTTVFTLLALMGLTACTNLFPNHDDNHKRTCSELKHRIMFSNGAGAMDENQAFQQRTQLDKLNQSYHEENCD